MKIEAMLWVVVFVLIAISLLFPKTRPFNFFAIGVAIIAIVTVVVIAKRSELPTVKIAAPPAIEKAPIDFEQLVIEKLDKADPAASNRIAPAEIRFDQVRADAGAERGSIGTIVARLYNDSVKYTLTHYGYHLSVQDCIAAACTTVFEQRGLSAVSVPPNQARDVSIAIRNPSSRGTPPVKILGTAKILITPDATRAADASSSSTD